MGGLCPLPVVGGLSEADLSTQSTAPAEDARLPEADGQPRRAEGTQAATGQGAAPAVGLGPVAEARPGRERLPRRGRLRAPREIEALFRGGTRVERGSFVLLWRHTVGASAVAFMAGRRLGGSVVRNRARRRLREAFRRQARLLPAEGVQLCLVARRGALEAPWSVLMGEVGDALRWLRRRLPGAPVSPP